MPTSSPRRRRAGDRGAPGFRDVLAAAQAGEEWAWVVLVGSVSGQLLGYARSKGARDPEDIVAEVFVRITRGIGTFDGDESDFRSWTFTIAHHLLVDSHRRHARRKDDVADDGTIDALVAGDDTEETVLDRFGTTRASALIEQLPSDQADVLRLGVLGQLTTAQIADVLGKNPGGVRALRFRAMKRLHRSLREVATT